MQFKNLSRYLIISLFVLILLGAPSIQRESSAQDGEVPVPELGQPPDIAFDWVASGDQEIRGLNSAQMKYASYLPMAIDSSFPSTAIDCSENHSEKTLARLAKTDPNQVRQVMKCHSVLNQVARERALDMGKEGYFSHTNNDGYGPNYLVMQAGYHLPSWWPDTPDENYIESIAGGYTTAAEAWNAWLSSKNHRSHVLGEVDFWAEQTNYGMGYAYVPGSPFGHYWVFITAPPEGG